MANKKNLLNIFVLTWKDSNSTYFPNGSYRTINCFHQNEGIYGVNNRGEVTPLPNTTFLPLSSPPQSPPLGSPPSDWTKQTALVQEGNVWGTPYPFPTGNANFHLCYKIKDLSTNITYYCDVADFNNKIAGCNLAPYNSGVPYGGCGNITGLLVTPNSASGLAAWTLPAGAIGAEWYNDANPAANPATDGTYIDGGTSSVTITVGGGSGPWYFHIRSICGLGVRGTYVTYGPWTAE
jgi:hypothetical protein